MQGGLETRGAEYGELRERMSRAVRRVAPSWLQDRVEDLVQVGLMKIVRSGKVEDDVEMNNAFLYRIAHSVVVDEIRRDRRRNETTMEHGLPETPEPSVRTNPEAMCGGQEIGTAIVECLAHLSDDRRRAVTLYLQGHSVPECARLLGFKTKKAENLVYRGLADLRRLLRKAGFEP